MNQIDSTGLKRLHRQWRRLGHDRLSLVLDRVQNPFNVGAIVRTAAAQRIERLYLGASTSPDDPKAAKTAMGTQRYVPWNSFEDPLMAIRAARQDGYRIVGVELATQAQPLHELDLCGATALVIGHEQHGLSNTTLDACDLLGFIPQLGRVGSLNTATATAIAIYETRRQGWAC